MFGNLGCSPFIKSVVYSSRSEPKAQYSETAQYSATLIQNNHALQLTLFSLGRRDEKLAYLLHLSNNLTNTSCVFHLGISLKNRPSRNENEIVTSIPFK